MTGVDLSQAVIDLPGRIDNPRIDNAILCDTTLPAKQSTSASPYSYLLASLDELESNLVASQTTIWHDSVFENNSLEISVSSIPKISCGQICSHKVGVSQSSFDEAGASEISINKQCFSSNNSIQFSSTQISIGEFSSKEHCPTQVSSTQITASKQENAQIQLRQIGMAENQALGIHPNGSQVGTSEIHPAQISSTQTPFLNTWAHNTSAGLIEPSLSALIPLVLIEDQVDLSKIPLASSITLQQFFKRNILPFHTSNSVLTNTYQDKLLNLWQTLFDPTFDLTFQITDNITAKLTPDLSLLDPKHYPYDLMNTTLTPGVRKLSVESPCG